MTIARKLKQKTTSVFPQFLLERSTRFDPFNTYFYELQATQRIYKKRQIVQPVVSKANISLVAVNFNMKDLFLEEGDTLF